MIETFRELMGCLRGEAARYLSLLALAERQKEILIEGKVEDLPENVRLEEKELFALGPLTASRRELLGKIAGFHQRKSVSLEQALNLAPAEVAGDFREAAGELVRAAKRLEQANAGNEKLMGKALSYVNFTLEAIRSGGKKKSFVPSAALREENKPSFVNRVI
jgi:flagellar biosynthesis/type III secretory pathway chaperone